MDDEPLYAVTLEAPPPRAGAVHQLLFLTMARGEQALVLEPILLDESRRHVLVCPHGTTLMATAVDVAEDGTETASSLLTCALDGRPVAVSPGAVRVTLERLRQPRPAVF